MRQSVISAGRTEADFRFAPALRRFIEAIFAAGAFLTLTGKLSGVCGVAGQRVHQSPVNDRRSAIFIGRRTALRVQLVLGRILVVVGYALVAFAAIMTPFAYALDLLQTLPAIAIALLVIAVGVASVLLGDKIAEGRGDAAPGKASKELAAETD